MLRHLMLNRKIINEDDKLLEKYKAIQTKIEDFKYSIKCFTSL